MKNYESSYKDILNRLESIRRKENLTLLISSLAKTIGISLLAVLLISIIELIAFSSIPFRTFLAFSGIATIAFALIYFLAPQLLRALGIRDNPSHIELSKRIGNFYPNIKDKLTNAIQLVPIIRSPRGTSSSLAQAAFEEINERIKDADFNVIINRERLKKSLLFALMSSLISLGSFAIFNESLGEAFYRVKNYNQAFIPPAPFTLKLEPIGEIKLRGESLKIKIITSGVAPETISLMLKENAQESYDEYQLSSDESGVFSYEIKSLKNSITFYGKADWMGSAIITETGKVEVIDKPIIKSISGKLSFPSYTRLSERSFTEMNADISALNGSRVNLSILANKELENAKVVYIKKENLDDSTRADTNYISLDVEANSAKGGFAINGSGNYYIEITGKSKQVNESPISYGIIALEDMYPTINMSEPLADVQVGRDAMLPIRLSITDDYGFSSLKLKYKLLASEYSAPDNEYTELNIKLTGEETIKDIAYLWNLNDLGIAPKDIFEFYIVVADNDIVNGPKTAETRKIKVRLPSLDEVVQETENIQANIEKKLEKLAQDADKLKKDMEKLNRKLAENKNAKTLDWKTQKEAENILKKQAEISKEFENARKELEQATQKMEQNNLLSQETLQEYKALQDLMKEVNSEEFRMMQKRMQDAMKNMTPQDMKQAMENFKFDEEQFRKSIERTKKILQKMIAQQKADALKRKAEELADMQDELTNEMNNSDSNDQQAKDKLSKKQESLSKEFEKMQEEMQDLEDLLKEFGADEEIMDEFEKSKENLSEEETAQEMQKSQNNIKKSDFSKAEQNQKKASQNLRKFSEQMQQMSSQMRENQTEKAIKTMQKAVEDLTELSKEQESLKQKTALSDYNSTQIPQFARKQSELNEGLEKVTKSMTELSQETFAVTPEMAMELGEAMNEMQKSISEMSDRQVSQSSQSQSKSMTALNRAIGMMQQMVSQMQQSGSCNNPGGQGQGQSQGQGMGMGSGSGGMMPQMSPGQQMQQLAAQQQAVNQALQKMLEQGQGGRLSQEQMSQKERISGQQGKAMGGLEELKKRSELPGGEKLKGRLSEISDDMKEVMKDIESGNVNEETLKKQERILSRMLDAYRSINERDFEKKRESERGRNYSSESPAALEFLDDETRRKAIRDLLRSNSKKYSDDYERLIKIYFDNLDKKSEPALQ